MQRICGHGNLFLGGEPQPGGSASSLHGIRLRLTALLLRRATPLDLQGQNTWTDRNFRMVFGSPLSCNPGHHLNELSTSMHRDIQDLVLGVWCLVLLGIRRPAPDFARAGFCGSKLSSCLSCASIFKKSILWCRPPPNRISRRLTARLVRNPSAFPKFGLNT